MRYKEAYFMRFYKTSTSVFYRRAVIYTAAVPRYYGGSTEAVLRQYYSDNPFIGLLIKFFHVFDCYKKTSRGYNNVAFL